MKAMLTTFGEAFEEADTYTGARPSTDYLERLLGSADAAILILLPIAAAAIGMMAFGIEFQIAEHVGL